MGERKDVAAEKAAWRERFRARRRALAEAERAAQSARITERLRALPEVQAARAVHLFWPLPDEVDLRPLAEALHAEGHTVVLPVVDGRTLVHRQFSGAAHLVAGPWGLLEPPPEAPEVPAEALGVVLVPGLAVGRDGTRLGYGGGFYDGFLARTPALRVGVAFSEALAETVPTEPHDARLDLVVTPAETVRVATGAAPPP